MELEDRVREEVRESVMDRRGRGRGGEEGREGWKQWEGRDRVSSASSPVSPPSCSGDGSATSGASEEVKSPAAMAQAVKVHQDTSRVMYFA